MSQLFDWPASRPRLICVVDSSVLIEFKKIVGIDEQWDMLEQMKRLVELGQLTFPKQVAKELAYGQHPDAPGAWIGSAKNKVRYAEPSDETLVTVLDTAAELVDVEATDDREVADPYVAAMAVEIARNDAECDVVVATNDIIDRMPVKLSLGTACSRLGLKCWSAEKLIDWVVESEDG